MNGCNESLGGVRAGLPPAGAITCRRGLSLQQGQVQMLQTGSGALSKMGSIEGYILSCLCALQVPQLAGSTGQVLGAVAALQSEQPSGSSQQVHAGL